jgi:pimeloyl-ACP methyl ester carboxylesterase
MGTVTSTMEEVSFQSDGREISGRLFRPARDEPSARGLLFIHGLGSDQSGYEPRAARASDEIKSVCLTFDLSGHGQSSGSLAELTPHDHLDDVLAAYDHLASSAETGLTRIGVCGASYGAYMASLLLSWRHVQRLLIRAPALYPDGDMMVPLGRRRTSGVGVGPNVALDNLRHYAGQVLILESGKDEVIPHSVVQEYLDACQGRARYQVIAGATHALTDDRWRAEFLETIVSWFSSM